jgi:hypothetical protein
MRKEKINSSNQKYTLPRDVKCVCVRKRERVCKCVKDRKRERGVEQM